MEAHNLSTTPMPTHTLVRFFTGGRDPIESLLCVRQVHLIGAPISWNFRVITRAPQDIVIGLDLILRFNLHFDPSKCRLFRLPPLRRRPFTPPSPPTRANWGPPRYVYTSSHDPRWDATDLWHFQDQHLRNKFRYTPRGVFLHNVTASGKEEERRYQEFYQELPVDLRTVVGYHPSLFEPPDSEPPPRHVKHLIITKPDVVPVRRAAYPLSGTKLAAMHEQVSELVKKGWIQPSTSPWAAPILFVSKDGGTKLRLCIDFRDLNALTKKDAFPLPCLDLALHKAAQAAIFSKIDLASGFHQIEVHPPHRELTAFILPEAVQGCALWEWKVMPFGLVNAPATFQRAMSFALQDCAGFAICYIDDILVYSHNRQQHLEHLSRVFHCLGRHKYHVRLEKCQFMQSTVNFLGHVITPSGIQAADNRDEALQAFTTPFTNARQVQSFLGLIMWYKSFIPTPLPSLHPFLISRPREGSSFGPRKPNSLSRNSSWLSTEPQRLPDSTRRPLRE